MVGNKEMLYRYYLQLFLRICH